MGVSRSSDSVYHARRSSMQAGAGTSGEGFCSFPELRHLPPAARRAAHDHMATPVTNRDSNPQNDLGTAVVRTAENFGLSSVDAARTCKKMGVPTRTPIVFADSNSSCHSTFDSMPEQASPAMNRFRRILSS
jgi:hypothetical protein